MTQHELSDAQIDRARIDGGFSFALAAFILGIGLLAVLDRIGLPDEMLRVGVLALIFIGLAVIGVMMRTMRPADFYVGGRSLPAVYAGVVFAGAGFALFLPYLPPLPQGISFASIAIGFCVGFLWLLFVMGPILRRNGANSFADLIGARFPLFSVRIPIMLLTALCAAGVALGGYEMALHSLVAALGIDRGAAALCLAALLILFVVPGGLSGVIWIAAAGAVITAAALLLPLGFGLLAGLPVASPIFGDQMLWVRELGDLATVTGADPQARFELPIVIAFGLGLSLLAPLSNAAVASQDVTTAWRSGLAGTAWLVIGALLISATLAGAMLAVKSDIAGRAPADLPSGLLEASGRGAVAICGVHSADAAAVAAACASKGSVQAVRIQDLAAASDDLLASLPMLRGAEPTLARLASGFMIVLGLALAAAGIQSFVTSLAHDLLPSRQRRRGPASRRLAIARALAIGFIICACLWLPTAIVDPRVLFTFAVMLSAAIVAPLVLLALMPQSSSLGAFAALCVSTFVMVHFFASNSAEVSLAQFASDTIFAAADGLAVGLFISFLPKRKPPVLTQAPEEADVAREKAEVE